MAVLASETASATAGREGKATSPTARSISIFPRPGQTAPAPTRSNYSRPAIRPASAPRLRRRRASEKIALKPNDIKVTATVNLNKDESGAFLDVTLNAELNGVDQREPERSSPERTPFAPTQGRRAATSR